MGRPINTFVHTRYCERGFPALPLLYYGFARPIRQAKSIKKDPKEDVTLSFGPQVQICIYFVLSRHISYYYTPLFQKCLQKCEKKRKKSPSVCFLVFLIDF
jgi:hypothetical protein